MTRVRKTATAKESLEVPLGVRIVGSQLRSTSLERDVAAGELPPTLHVGTRISDALERLAGALEERSRTRAWALTGPYGSGKSTLALLITALLGTDVERQKRALEYVHAANERLATRMANACEKAAPRGALLAVAAARQEPLSFTVRRALHNAVAQYWPTPADEPPAVHAAMIPLNESDCTSGQILDAVAALCAAAPVLLVIDEFGKSLEYLVAQGANADSAADLYLLQELAEKGAGRNGLPLYIFTLQHLSFGDYATRVNSQQTREWAKVQGRFEEVTFTTEIGDSIALLRRCLDHSEVAEDGQALLRSYDAVCAAAWEQLGLDGVFSPEPGTFADLYPLHPVTAIAAPLLAAQVGQHDRSLTGFLAGDEPNSTARFIKTHAVARPSRASTVRLAQLYDYFLASGRTTIAASANASRWIEIDTQLAEAHGLPEFDLTVLKTVALLNLIDSSGALRATARMIIFALGEPTEPASEARSKRLFATLTSLVERGFLVYREFSDEYRVWRGSDVDLKSRIDEIWERADSHTILKVVSRYLPQAIVAGRHSQMTGMLRYFTTVATDATTENITGPAYGDSPDGVVIFHLGTENDIPQVRSSQPVVVGLTKKAPAVLETARYVYALEELLEDDTLDAVARREATERLSQAVSDLATRYNEAFAPALTNSQWLLYRPPADFTKGKADQGPEPLIGHSFAAIVSAACEAVYPLAPHIRNEMLGRTKLTSQAAKARRELLTAMVERPFDHHLGINGYGPERAMYHGVLEYLGLHTVRSDVTTSDEHTDLVPFGFAEPAQGSPVYPVWQALNDALTSANEQVPLTKIYQVLSAPPYGVKDGVIPILVVTALLLRADDIALFRQGTYQPRLTAALVELVQSSPAHFTVKAAPTSGGQRRLILDQLAESLNIGAVRQNQTMRNPLVLLVANALLDQARILTPYGRRTKRISREAQAIRGVLLSASDPISLIFTEIPAALDLPPVMADSPRDEPGARHFAAEVANALLELASASTELRSHAMSAVASAFKVPAKMPDLRRGIADLARGFVGAQLESKLQGLVNIATNTTMPDDDWFEPLAVLIAGNALADWSDAQAEAFPRLAQQLAHSLDRVGHLYDASAITETLGSIPVQTRLVTVTDAGGQETRTLVRMPEDVRVKAAKLAREILKKAYAQLGADGGRILLAALAQELLAVSDGDASMDSRHVAAPASPREGKA